MNLLDLVQQHLGPTEIQQISQHLGTDSATTSNAIQAALPMIVGAMGQTAQQPSGASGILAALEQHGASGSSGGLLGALGGLSAMFSGTSASSNNSGLLGSLLGSHASTVQSGIQQASGLDAGKVEKLLAILAPIVMTALVQHQSTAAAGNSGLGGLLQQAASAAQGSSSPQVSGVLGQILGRLH